MVLITEVYHSDGSKNESNKVTSSTDVQVNNNCLFWEPTGTNIFSVGEMSNSFMFP